jgi:SpoVK/Ycf46/Vps4 family AAA+-type ATPase
MTTSEIIKKLFQYYTSKDDDSFVQTAREYIEREKRKKHNLVVKELEKALHSENFNTPKKHFKEYLPIPRDTENGFPLLEIQEFDYDLDGLILSKNVKHQLTQIIKEFKDADILATYNLKHKKKILLCGSPGTGKTFSAETVSSILNIPLAYIRFDAIISSYLGETATNLRKVFDYIETGTWIVLFDEVDIIGKNRDDSHDHGEIKRVVNNFLQMLDNFKGDSIIFAATNHQHMLDSAIWRRFDDVVYYDLPNQKSREMLFNLYMKSIKRRSNINTLKIAKKAVGLSPSDIKMVIENAMKIAILESRDKLSIKDIEKSIKDFICREKVKNNKFVNKTG